MDHIVHTIRAIAIIHFMELYFKFSFQVEVIFIAAGVDLM